MDNEHQDLLTRRVSEFFCLTFCLRVTNEHFSYKFFFRAPSGERKSEHVRDPVLAAPGAVQAPHLFLADERNRKPSRFFEAERAACFAQDAPEQSGTHARGAFEHALVHVCGKHMIIFIPVILNAVKDPKKILRFAQKDKSK